MSTPVITVVGLGPAGVDLLLPAARAAIERVPLRYVRTSRHPCVDDLAREGLTFDSFDEVYDRGDDLDAVYDAIVDKLVEAASRASADGQGVLYAVPGSPVVAERTVAMLVQVAGRSGTLIEIVPGVSFADLAWARLGVDPMHGARVVDGRSFGSVAESDLDLSGQLLIAQCDARDVLSDVKLALLEYLRPETPVSVMQRLGMPNEQIIQVPLAELDHREVTPDHLTSVFVDLPSDRTGASWSRFVRLVERLRAPGGCPWDAEQTHHSLTRHLLEETYEVLEAIESLPTDAPGGATPAPAEAYESLEEELGDLLVQAVFHTTLAREAGAFTIVEVVDGIHDKLVRRHPHVFGDVEETESEQVLRNWEQIKKAEKGAVSLMDQVPGNLPSLLYAHKLYRKAASAGMELGSAEELVEVVATEVDRMRGASPGEAEERMGALLGAIANLARALGLDAEATLRGWAAGFRARFQAMEVLAEQRNLDLPSLGSADRDALWHEAASST